MTQVAGEPVAKNVIIVDPVEGSSYVLDDRTHTARRSQSFNAVSAANVRVVPGTAVSNTITVATAGTPGAGATELPRKISVSGGVLQGSAVKRVPPVYPPEAKAAKVSGAVQVQITINEAGEVVNAEAVSGHPLLREPAVAAARQWQFKATEISGQSVKIQGTLTFNFTLQDEGSAVNTVSVVRTQEGSAGIGTGVATATAGGTMMRRVNLSNSEKTSLGKQNIEGIECDRTRIVETIPAGTIGNEQPLQIVTESWYSPELQVVVLSKHSDPRTGETTTRMANVLRSEPDESLFKVPSDYTVQQANQNVLLRTAKPE